MRFINHSLIAWAFFSASIAAASSKLPQWLEESMSGIQSEFCSSSESDAIALRYHTEREYKTKLRVDTLQRSAIYIKNRNARDRAIAYIEMGGSTRKLLRFKAWLIYPSGKIETFGKRDLIEYAAERDSLYSERVNSILDRSYSARDGVVFAYEYSMTEKSIFLQGSHYFQDTIPVLHSSLKITVPSSWSAPTSLVTSEKIQYRSLGSSHFWEALQMDDADIERDVPPGHSQFAHLGYTLLPGSGSERDERRLQISNWNDVARYAEASQIDRIQADDAVRQKTLELIHGLESEWEKIQAICAYAQTINYSAVSVDLSTGGGYEPFDAVTVFRRHYGDCKDMTALTRSMLAEAGIESHSVLAAVSPGSAVNPDWPSPFQFDHCIVAIETDSALSELATVDHPSLGSLLIFDPTQRYTPVGVLPRSLIGSNVLVGHHSSSELNQLSVEGNTSNVLRRETDATINAFGDLSGTITEVATGSMAEYLRWRSRALSKKDFEDEQRDFIARGTKNAQITSVRFEDDFDNNAFRLETEFISPRYARIIGQNMISLRPVFVGRHDWEPPEEETRKHAYFSEPWSLIESTAFTLPENFILEALPEASLLERDFASYKLMFKAVANTIKVDRSLVSERQIVPAAEFQEVVSFYEEATRIDSAPVLFKYVAP